MVEQAFSMRLMSVQIRLAVYLCKKELVILIGKVFPCRGK